MAEKKAKISLTVQDVRDQEKLLSRYTVGTKIGPSGIVEKIERLGHQIVIYFRAASNAILSVFGSFKDSVGCQCTLVPL